MPATMMSYHISWIVLLSDYSSSATERDVVSLVIHKSKPASIRREALLTKESPTSYFRLRCLSIVLKSLVLRGTMA